MVLKIKIHKLQIICKTCCAAAQKSDKNSLTYDKMKNGCGLLALKKKKIQKFLNINYPEIHKFLDFCLFTGQF